MQIKVNNKHILLYLLICSLFLTSYISILNINGVISLDVNVFDIFSTSDRVEHSSMNGGANVGYNDYLPATNTSTELSIFSMQQSRWLGTKTSPKILTAIVAALLACLFYYSRHSNKICPQLNSLLITIFLHKKDGMK